MVFAPITKSSRLDQLDPVCHDATQRLHSQLVESMAKELLQGVDVADVEGARLFSNDFNGPTLNLEIFAANIWLAIRCQSLSN